MIDINVIKQLLGIGATCLVFVGYVPYFRGVISGKIRPHIYSWLVWSIVAFIVFALQVSGGAGAGSLVTLATALMCVGVIILSYVLKRRVEAVKMDLVFLVLAVIALGFWLIAKQPVLSIVLATTVDLLAFVPTVRKTWSYPHTETVTFYYFMTWRFGLAVLALQKYSVVTALYPVTWLVVELCFALMLIVRQRMVTK